MSRYPKQQWQSGVIASPFGPINGPRLSHLEDWLDTIFTDFDAHVAGVGDVHPQYLLEPAMVANGVLFSTGAAWTVAKLGTAQLAANAGILKSQLAPLGLVDADVTGPISKGKLDLAGQVGPADLAPNVGLIPSGAVLDYGGDVAPGGWVLCDGSTYDGTNSTYTPLWNVLGTKFGGTGQSSFKVPDFRGRVAVGKGTHADVDTVGKSDAAVLAFRRPTHAHLHTLTLPNHVHADPGHFHATSFGTTTGSGGTSPTAERLSTNVTRNTDTKTTGMGDPTTHPAIDGAIGQAGINDSPAYLVTNKIIKL